MQTARTGARGPILQLAGNVNRAECFLSPLKIQDLQCGLCVWEACVLCLEVGRRVCVSVCSDLVSPTEQVAKAAKVLCVATSKKHVTFFCLPPLAVPFSRDACLENSSSHPQARHVIPLLRKHLTGPQHLTTHTHTPTGETHTGVGCQASWAVVPAPQYPASIALCTFPL